MLARFRISQDDYVDAMLLFARLTLLWVAVTASIGIALLLLAVFGPLWSRSAAIGGLAGGAVVMLTMHFMVTPRTASQHYRKYKAIQGDFSVELLDTGVRLVSEHGDYLLVWENILKWRQNDRFVLMFPMPRMFHIVPKSVAEQGFDLAGLVERLNRHVGPAY